MDAMYRDKISRVEWKCFCLLIFCVVSAHAETTAVFRRYITKDSTLIALSNFEATFNQARDICLSAGGKLSQIDNYSKDFILPVLKEEYVADFALVKIYQNPHPESPFFLQFRTDNALDRGSLVGWNNTSRGKLKSFRMYKQPHPGFTQVVRFYYVSNTESKRRGLLVTGLEHPWYINFMLYAATVKPNVNAIKLNNFWYRPVVGRGLSSNVFLENEDIPPFYYNGSELHEVLYIPDISVFTGARSDVNQTNWFWENGTMVNDSKYPTSNQSVCQQMSLPLTYDDGNNLSPKNCEDDKAHYACEFQPVFRKYIARGQTHIALSNFEATLNQAKDICSSAGGKLSQIDNYSKYFILPVLIEEYLSDFALVEIYRNPHPESPFYLQFRTDNAIDISSLEGWNNTSTGKLKSFRMYKQPHPGFMQAMSFAYLPDVLESDQRGLLVTGDTIPWTLNFKLYAATDNADVNAIILNNFWYRQPPNRGLSSNVFLENEDIPFFYYNGSERHEVLYIPDISIFTGARSDVNQTNWFWENGTMVNDLNYPTSNQSACQQMSLPLTYDDGINLLPKDCEDDKAHYACEFQALFRKYIAKESTLIAFSNFEATLNQAKGICLSAGGKLSQIDNYSKDFILPVLKEEYVADFALVEIYRNPHPESPFYLLFRTDNATDTSSLEGWNNTSTGKLKSFRMYKQPHPGFTQGVIFYYVGNTESKRRGLLVTGREHPWYFNFILYAATVKPNVNAIKLNNFWYRPVVGRGLSSNVFLENEDIPPFYYNGSERHEVLYIPDISIFTGARSDLTQTNWFWENGTMVNDSNYPTSNQSVCQQMSLPLTYDDGINLLPKNCKDKAHYSCEFQLSLLVSLRPLSCSGNLDLSWNINLDRVFESLIIGHMQIEILGSGFTYNISYNQSPFTLRNLTGNINYTVKATATIDQPFQGLLNSTTSTRTERQQPRAVEIAYVNSSSTSLCILQWLHKWSSNDPFQKPTAYEIQVHNQGMINNLTLDLPDEAQQLNKIEIMLQYGVDMSLYPLNTSLYFKIRTSSGDCGFGDTVMVNGTCKTPQQINSFQRTLVDSNNSLILLSSTRKNAVEAQRVCSNLNGSIAISDNYNQQRVYPVLKETYVKDLVLVEIFQLPSKNYTYKFQADGYPVAVNVFSWMQPITAGTLRSFRMHKMPYGSFTRKVNFCYYQQASFIRVVCNASWIADFDLFGGNGSLNSTIKLFNYIRRNGFTVSSNLFLTVPNMQDFYLNPYAINPIHIPDISIFTGARSDVNQTNWYWGNGTMVNDSKYPTSNQSVCQQMSLPLTYDDGINLLPKNCEDDEAYFACEVELVFTFEEVKCNASVLNLSWNLHSFLEENATIQVLVQEINQTYFAPFNQSYMTIGNLQKQTNYTVMTLISLSQPHDSVLSSKISTRTGNSPFPRPVEVAYINRSNPSSCIVEWLYKWSESDSFERPFYHQIQIRSQNNVHSVTIDRPDSDKNQIEIETILQYTVDWSLYPPNSTLSFIIRAGTRCGFSEFFVVNGTCNNPAQPNEFKQILAVSNNSLALLTSRTENATTANMICSRLNGSITSIGRDYEKQKILPILLDAYVKDLANIEIFQNPDRGFDYSYIYQVRNFSEWRNISTWNVPANGSLRSIRLYKIPYGSFTERVKFCKFNVQDAIILSCTGGWIPNFDLFGGPSSFENTIQVNNYRYQSNRVLSSNLFHMERNIGTGFAKLRPMSIYIPDISIFTGARSDVNQTKWFWENGTRVNDSNYPISNQSVCQQMSLPLTYDDGINLLPKNCEDNEAYLACEVPFSFTLSEVECNAKALQLSWNYGNLVDEEATVQIMINEYDELPYTVPFSQGYFIIDGLEIQTKYNIKISLDCTNCYGSNVSWTLTRRTGIGLFEDFISDPVVDSSCLIQWNQSVVLENFTSYKIRSKIDTSLFNVTVDQNSVDHLPPDIFQYAVDPFRFEKNLQLSFEIQALYKDCESEFKGIIGTCSSQILNPSSLVTFIGVGLGVGLAALVILVTVGVIFYRRKSSKSKSIDDTFNTADDLVDDNGYIEFRKTRASPKKVDPVIAFEANYETIIVNPTISSAAKNKTLIKAASTHYENVEVGNSMIDVKNLKEYYVSECLNGFPNLKSQFEQIFQTGQAKKQDPIASSKSVDNDVQKLENVFANDCAFVKISGNKYIDASNIKGSQKCKNYIATQGPKPETVDDFWEMVWIQKASIIVMLCKCVENGKTVCEMYWPAPSLISRRRNLEIGGKSERNLGEITKRTFLVKNIETQEKRTITQFHYISWPDHGVPTTTSCIVYLQNLVNKEYFGSSLDGPIIVHSNTGTGRTGTYIAFDQLSDELRVNEKVDVMRKVLAMEQCGRDMIENEHQYVWLHKILVETHILPVTDHPIDEFSKFFDTPNWMETVSNEFCLLLDQLVTTPALPAPTQTEESIYLNDSSGSSSAVKFYSKLQTKQVAMNANYVKSGYYPGTFIASGGPQANKEDEFWEMVLIKKCQIVVALESLANDSLSQKCDSDDASVLEFGNIRVTVQQTTDYKTILVKQLTVFLKEDAEESLEVTYVLAKNYSKEPIALSSTILDIVRKLKASLDSNVNSSALVYCRHGYNKTGVLLAAAMIVERMKYERKIDVFRTVKDLRDYRPRMINELADYKDCYLVIKEYIATTVI